MNKEQQIEEIRHILENYIDYIKDECDKCVTACSRYNGTCMAYALYNAGYRKIENGNGHNLPHEIELLLDEYTAIRKKTVEEFAEKLKAKYDYDEDSYGVPVIPMYKIGETLKEMEDES